MKFSEFQKECFFPYSLLSEEETQESDLLAVQPLMSYSTSLCLSFFTYKMGMMTGACEGP